MGALSVGFEGEEIVHDPDRTLTFGRSGDLVIDAGNNHLHRVLGCFAAQGDVWFLQNLGRFITLHVLDADGPSCTTVAPGEQLPIGFEAFRVEFSAGPTDYRIDVTRPGGR